MKETLTIHAIRTGENMMLSEREFSELLRKVRQIEPVKVIETEAEVMETEEDRRAYLEGMKELEQNRTIGFNEVRQSWLLGKSADV